jgi:mono/diheme cytochrome c family protein
MVKLLGRLIMLVLLLAGVAAIVGVGALAMGGISARQEPGRLEMAAASKLRSLAIPASAKDARNPVPASAEAIAEGLEHFADHCAICHANDGSGDTEIGKSMYPRVPDMRKAETQNLTDGELFYIIENGVKLTGMPAWGHEDANDNWKLVHFIRHQPKLTPQELARMQALNPRAPAEEPMTPEHGKPAPKPHTHKEPHK